MEESTLASPAFHAQAFSPPSRLGDSQAGVSAYTGRMTPGSYQYLSAIIIIRGAAAPVRPTPRRSLPGASLDPLDPPTSESPTDPFSKHGYD